MWPRLVLVAAAAIVYLLLPAFGATSSRPPGHFPQLAKALLDGKLSIEVTSATDSQPGAGTVRIDELIPATEPWDATCERYYCPYPPLPAVLLMPFVAVFGFAIKVETACRVVAVLAVWLFDACLIRLPRRLGLDPLTVGARIAVNMLFAFGTVCWHNAEFGGDWHLAHAVALTALLAALREYLGGNRPMIVGCFLAAAILARPTTALTGLFFAMPYFRARAVPQLVKLAAGPAFAVFILALYNNARFGSPTDFGYAGMLLRGDGLAMMTQYGQFHPNFVPRNAFWFFLAPPWRTLDGRFPFLGFDPRGLSLFLATPAMLYVFRAVARRWRCDVVRDAMVGVFACLVPLLLYFNTGYWQFGHRFSMDYLALLMLLVVAGMGSRPSRWAYGLIAVSIVAQAVGVLLAPVARLPIWLVPVV